MLDLIIEPLQYGFMQRALLVSALAAVACGIVGVFVVLRGMAFLGDAIAHSALTGMAAAFLVGANIFLGALIWAVPASLAISALSRQVGVRVDAIIGVLFAGGFALGIIIISTSDSYSGDLLSVLFGSVLGASWGDALATGLLAGGVLLVIALFYKELVFFTYDRDVALASGVPVRLLEYLLPLLVALTTVAALKAVGNVMVMSLLVVPAVTGTLLAQRLHTIMAATVAVALAAIVSGLYLSYLFSLPTGPAIVMMSVGILLLAAAVSPRRVRAMLAWRRRDAVLPDYAPEFAPAADVNLPDDAPVIGLVINGAARAYPAGILYRRELVNDVVGGVPVLVSWCPLCCTALAHDRRQNGAALVFGNQEALYNGAMTWCDHETGSVWSQPLGAAIAGPQAGAELRLLPSQLSTWGQWRAAYPDTRALVDAAAAPPYLGPRPGAGHIAGVTIGDAARAWPYPSVAEQGPIRERVGNTPVVIWQDDRAGAIRAAAGDTGQELPVIIAYRTAWLRFYPPDTLAEGGPERE